MNIENNSNELEKSLRERNFTFTQAKLNEITSFAGFAMIINLILGTGPFTVPFFAMEAGLVLSPILLILAMIVAYISATFIIESLSTCNAVESYAIARQSLIDNNIEKESLFGLKKSFEFTKISAIMLGTAGRLITVCIISFYLFGAVAIKCVAAAESLSSGLSYLIYGDGTHLNAAIGFDLYYVLLGLFALFVIGFCLGDISKLSTLNSIIVVFRLLTVVMLICGAVYSMFRHGVTPISDLPKANIKAVPSVFSTFIFYFMMHHSLPTVVRPMKPEKEVKPVMLISYVCSMVILVWIAISGMFAFGHFGNDCEQGFPCKINKLYNKNFLGIPFLGQLVNLYPVLNIAPTPVLVIVLRNNLINLIFSDQKPESLPQSLRVLMTIVSFLPSIIACYVLRYNLDSMISITGALGGTFLVFILPSLMIWKSRKLLEEVIGKYSSCLLYTSPSPRDS
eukprot:TRINITY_DN9818_c0_g1_i1.p1 TRINITY_DN9818_c0_g1~~TRINITY_DN9818_c0_g1_i1.p1  ORF type:complete len:453 (-),score=43.79 TRINITY_DN9818_c0_g1_i1:63-1421(-)